MQICEDNRKEEWESFRSGISHRIGEIENKEPTNLEKVIREANDMEEEASSSEEKSSDDDSDEYSSDE